MDMDKSSHIDNPIDYIGKNVCTECTTLFNQMKNWYETKLKVLREELDRVNGKQKSFETIGSDLLEEVLVICDPDKNIRQDREQHDMCSDKNCDQNQITNFISSHESNEHQAIKMECDNEEISIECNIKDEPAIEFIDNDFDTMTNDDTRDFDELDAEQQKPMPQIKKRSYICTMSGCNILFPNRTELREHKSMLHWEECQLEKKFFCEYPGCEVGYRYRSRLECHIKRSHTKLLPYRCYEPLCGKAFHEIDSLEKHKKRYHQTFACTVSGCNRTFRRISNLEKHTAQHYSVETDKFKCQLARCNQFFETEDDAINHKLTAHLNEEKPEKKYFCEYPDCGKGFVYQSRLNYHTRTTHASPDSEWSNCTVCGKETMHMERHMARNHTSSRKYNKCTKPDCDKQFLYKSELERHLRKHDGLDPFVCNIDNCDATFASKTEFNKHKVYVHNRVIGGVVNTNKYKCTEANCGKYFTYRSRLKFHISSVHQGHRPFICDMPNCGKGFLSKSELKRHMDIHIKTIERNFLCPHCGKTFKHVYSLDAHIKTHSDERPFLCDEPNCEKSFREESLLRLHKVIHFDERQFKCDVTGCGKTFKRKSSLHSHQSVHTGNRPYKCTFATCKRACTNNSSLRNHIRVCHLQVRPYECKYPNCGKAFPKPYKLRDHIKTHNKHR